VQQSGHQFLLFHGGKLYQKWGKTHLECRWVTACNWMCHSCIMPTTRCIEINRNDRPMKLFRWHTVWYVFRTIRSKTITLLTKCSDNQPLYVAFSISTSSDVWVMRLRPQLTQTPHVTVDDVMWWDHCSFGFLWVLWHRIVASVFGVMFQGESLSRMWHNETQWKESIQELLEAWLEHHRVKKMQC